MKFCSSCGGEMPDGSRFCSKCGTKINESQNGTATSAVPESQRTSKGRKKLYLGIGIGILILITIITPILKNSSKGPEKVVYDFMKSFYMGNPDLALESLSSDVLFELQEYVETEYPGYTEKEIQVEMKHAFKEYIEAANIDLSNSLGSDWFDIVKVETIELNKNLATVRVFCCGENIDIELIKEKRKWKMTSIPDLW